MYLPTFQSVLPTQAIAFAEPGFSSFLTRSLIIGVSDVPNICNSVNYTEIICGSFNATYSTVLRLCVETFRCSFSPHVTLRDSLSHLVNMVLPSSGRCYLISSTSFQFANCPCGASFWKPLAVSIFSFALLTSVVFSPCALCSILNSVVLVGHFIPEIGQLTTLRELSIYDSGTKDRNPDQWRHPPPIPEIGNLINLEYLCVIGRSFGCVFRWANGLDRNLAGHLMNGTIPASYAQLTKIRKFNMQKNLLESPLPDLSQLTKMTALELSSNLFAEPVPAWFGTFPVLESMYVFESLAVKATLTQSPPLPSKIDANNFNGPLPSFAICNRSLSIVYVI